VLRLDTAFGLPNLCVAQAQRPLRWFESGGGEPDHGAMLGPDGRIVPQPDDAAAVRNEFQPRVLREPGCSKSGPGKRSPSTRCSSFRSQDERG
jgi:hypothetical protein